MHLHRAVCVSQNAAVGAHFDPDAVHLHGHIAEIFPERNLPCLTTALTHDPRSFSTVVNDSSPDAEDRQLTAPVVAVLVAVAEPLTPSAVPAVGERLRQPDVPGGKRVTTAENLRECATFAFKGRQIIPLLPCRQRTALPFCPCGSLVMIHQLGGRRKPDGFVVGRVDAPVYLAFVFSVALYSANLVVEDHQDRIAERGF